MHPIAITNVALITPLTDVGMSTWDALHAGRQILCETAIHEDRITALAASLPSPARDMARDDEIDKSIRLAILAAALALVNTSPETHLFCGTSKGPACTILAALQRLKQGDSITRRQAEQIALGTGAMGPMVRQALGMPGPVHTSVAACSSGMHALCRAARAIDTGDCDRAVVVAADASLHPLFEGSFDRLGVLAPIEADGSRRCEPFSALGRGFFLTEAAAAVVLERLPSKTPLAWLEDIRIASDATHLIAVDPHTQALREVMRQTVASESPLAFIHAHATGTTHDAHELAAIRSFAPQTHTFSHKGQLGHTLGAAGLVSVVLSALSHAHGCTYEGHPVPALARSLTIAQGFGGHIAVAALR